MEAWRELEADVFAQVSALLGEASPTQEVLFNFIAQLTLGVHFGTSRSEVEVEVYAASSQQPAVSGLNYLPSSFTWL